MKKNNHEIRIVQKNSLFKACQMAAILLLAKKRPADI